MPHALRLRPQRRRSRRDAPVRPRFAAPGAIAHFGGLCRVVEQLQAEAEAPGHFERLVALAARLDHRGDGAGHLMRRSLCMSLVLQADRLAPARALIGSVAERPAPERADLYRLLEHLLIVDASTPQCRALHTLLATAAGTLRGG